MSLADQIHAAFAKVTATGQEAETLIAAVEAAMERMPQAELDAMLIGMGFEITQKRAAAQAIAIARAITAQAGPLLALL